MSCSPPAKLRILTLEEKADVAELLKDCLLYVDSDYFLALYDRMVTQAGSHCYGLMVNGELVSVCWLYTICAGSRLVSAGHRTKRSHQLKKYNTLLTRLAIDDFLVRYPAVRLVYGSQTLPHSELCKKDDRICRSPGHRRLLTFPRYVVNGTLRASSAQHFRREVSTGSPVKRLMDKDAAIELICSTKTSNLDQIFGPLDEPFSWNGQACFRLPFDIGAAMERFGGCLVKSSSNGEVVAIAVITRYPFNDSIGCFSLTSYGDGRFVEELLAEMLCLITEELPDMDYRFFLRVGYDAAQAERTVLRFVEKLPTLRLGKDRRGNIAVIIEYPKLFSRL